MRTCKARRIRRMIERWMAIGSPSAGERQRVIDRALAAGFEPADVIVARLVENTRRCKEPECYFRVRDVHTEMDEILFYRQLHDALFHQSSAFA